MTTLERASLAGWQYYGEKIDGFGVKKIGLLLPATDEVVWFDEKHLEVAFR